MKDRISPSAKTTQRLDTVCGAVAWSDSGPSSATGICSMRPTMSSSAPEDTAQRSFFTESSTWPSADMRMARALSAPTYRTVRACGNRKWAPRAMQLGAERRCTASVTGTLRVPVATADFRSARVRPVRRSASATAIRASVSADSPVESEAPPTISSPSRITTLVDCDPRSIPTTAIRVLPFIRAETQWARGALPR